MVTQRSHIESRLHDLDDTCKKPSTSLLSLTSYNTARFLLLCFVRFFKLYGNCAISRLSTQMGSGRSANFSKRLSKSPESNPSSGPGVFRVSSFVLAIWAEYCCGCAQMLDWSSWRGRGCERAVDVDRWRCFPPVFAAGTSPVVFT